MMIRSPSLLALLFLVVPAACRQLQTMGFENVYQATGKLALSIDGAGYTTTGSIDVLQPVDGTLVKAFLFVTTNNELRNPVIGIEGTDVSEWAGEAVNIISGNRDFFYSYFQDVTDIIADLSLVDGTNTLAVTEGPISGRIDGIALAVVFEDPSITDDTSVSLLFGALQSSGDSFNINFESPITQAFLDDENEILLFSLGIGFGAGGSQFSTIDVNGQRLSSSAGGFNDGAGAGGALLTVGGLGDSTENPSEPLSVSSPDDELYNLKPFLSAGDTSALVATANPSDDDNIFFGAVYSGIPTSTNVAARCGDGNLDLGEGCDDGNTVSGDGCSSTCAVEEADSNAPSMVPSFAPSDSTSAIPTISSPVTTTGFTNIFQQTGKLALSLDGAGYAGTGTIDVQKPAGSTLVKAFLFVTTNSGFQDPTIGIEGTEVSNWAGEAVNINTYYSYFQDVTNIIDGLNLTDGVNTLTVTEDPSTQDIDGIALAVVFEDPSLTDSTSVSLLFGALQSTGDSFDINFASPITQDFLDDEGEFVLFSLGIGFSAGGSQVSRIEVNGERLSSSAGGFEDGALVNGQLVTVGGLGDSPENPTNPTSSSSLDDELYNLKPFLSAGDTTVQVTTINPSNDDNIFFGAVFSGLETSTSVSSLCGNSVVDLGEGCDDGNAVSGDGCSATCVLESATAFPSMTPSLSSYPSEVPSSVPTISSFTTGKGKGKGKGMMSSKSGGKGMMSSKSGGKGMMSSKSGGKGMMSSKSGGKGMMKWVWNGKGMMSYGMKWSWNGKGMMGMKWAWNGKGMMMSDQMWTWQGMMGTTRH